MRIARCLRFCLFTFRPGYVQCEPARDSDARHVRRCGAPPPLPGRACLFFSRHGWGKSSGTIFAADLTSGAIADDRF